MKTLKKAQQEFTADGIHLTDDAGQDYINDILLNLKFLDTEEDKEKATVEDMDQTQSVETGPTPGTSLMSMVTNLFTNTSPKANTNQTAEQTIEEIIKRLEAVAIRSETSFTRIAKRFITYSR